MKPRSISPVRMLLVFLVSGMLLTLVSWGQQQIPSKAPKQNIEDTTKKKKKNVEARDLDQAIEELDRIDLDEHLEKAMKEVNEAVKQLDAAKVKMEIDKAMKEVDFEKLGKEMENTKVDWDKMKVEMEKSMKEVDFEKLSKEIETSMAKVDWDKMKSELDKSMKAVDFEKLSKEMEKLKQSDFSELEREMNSAKDELKKIQPTLEKELKEAQKEIEKAKVEMKEYKTFIDGLEKDGLIKKNENYTLEHKNGKLLINGKEAPAKVYQKYSSFLKKHPSINIRKDADDFSIDHD